MEIKIDLDMSKIDYDAINKQIAEKIADMDLTTNYNFKYKIENKINEEVEQCVTEFFRSRRWGGLNNSSKNEMEQMLYSKARDIINPHVSNIIAQIPEEELNKIIIDLIPKVLVDLLSSHLLGVLNNCYQTVSDTISAEAANRIKNSIY